jgi:type I restriction enzyme, S subunit
MTENTNCQGTAPQRLNDSRIEKLIAELCPEGVEFKELGEVLQRTKGTPITAKKMIEINKIGAPIKIYAGGKTVAYVDYGDIPEKDMLTKESVVVKSRGIIGFEFIDKPFSHKNEFWSYNSDNLNINMKYVFYYLKNNELYFQTVGQKMSKMPQLSIPDTDKYKIPIPPLAIQQEIVKILDTFTTLEAELEAELKARKQQYEYYQKKLLMPNVSSYITLNEVGKVSMCKRIFKNETSASGDIPFYKIGTFGKEPNAFISQKIYDEYREKYSFPKKGDVLLSASGTIGRRVIYNGEPAYFQDSNIIWLDNDESKVLNKYLYYLYETVEWRTEGGTIQRLYNDNLKKIQIPIPPLAEQERIVAILDKFDALVNDISVGLPAELNTRRKQYEYYRNKLLTFKKFPSSGGVAAKG